MKIVLFDQRLKEETGSYLLIKRIRLSKKTKFFRLLDTLNEDLDYDIKESLLSSTPLILINEQIATDINFKVKNQDEVALFLKR
jgi:hypothetical protein